MTEIAMLARSNPETQTAQFKAQLDALAEEWDAVQAAQAARAVRNERFRERWLEGFWS